MLLLVLQGRPLLATAADARLFVDRQEQIDQLERSVRRGFNTALYGNRGVGKSSLLHHLAYREREARRVAYVDGVGLDDVSVLVDRVVLALTGRPTSNQAMREVIPRLSETSQPGALSTWLTEQVRSLAAVEPTVVLIDASGGPDAVYGLFGRLRDELWQLEHRWVACVDTDDWHRLQRPPADAFFDITIEIPALSGLAMAELLARRQPELNEHELAQIVTESDGNPRFALDLVRQTLIRERPLDEIVVARTIRGEAASRLGRPHRMLLAELEGAGRPLSPSDEQLLQRMGWTRERAGQVFRDLEDAGVVASSDEAQDRGRPRKLYFPAPHSMRELRVLSELRGAMASGDIVVAYQPIVDLDDLTVSGAEAVVQWKHQELGLMSADDIISTIESTSLMGLLTHHVFERAVRACSEWRLTSKTISVAVSLLSVQDIGRDLPRETAELLSTYGLPAQALKIGVTEQMLTSDPDRTLSMVTRLSEQGVEVSVDHFGTGYSSLSSLRRLPINEIKLDKSFVSSMLRDEGDLIIVRSTINLGHDLGLRVVADGVEDSETLQRLALLGCDLAQGPCFGQPTSAQTFDMLVDSSIDLKAS
jgi:EAL domain-containing protein (putative c-di-GMP-specific phosphodiesterase class I)